MTIKCKMKAMIIIILSSTSVIVSDAGYLSLCEIEGVESDDWYYGKQLQKRIPDSQEGPFVQFNTKNIISIIEQKSIYFHATYKNNVLQLQPNSKFKSFEEDYENGLSTRMEIMINLECIQNTSESIRFIVHVEDVNDNDPIFDRSVYEYHFGMTVPEDYYLTNILSISAVDKDFTNNAIDFSIEYNTVLRLEYRGKNKYYDEKYFTTLKTLTEVKAPFRQKFVIVATDSGTPPRRSTADVILTVSSNASSIQLHHFIFSKSIYVAKYLYNHLQIEEPIKLSCSTPIILQQHGFEKNFKVEVKSNGIVQIAILQAVPDSIRLSKSFIVIDLEATCNNFSEKSALIINLVDNFSEKSFINLFTFYNNVGCYIVYVSALFAIIIINVKILYLYFQKHHKKFSMSLPL